MIGRRDVMAGAATAGLVWRGAFAEEAMTGLRDDGLADLERALARHVESGDLPGAAALVARGDATAVVTVGALDFGGAPVRRDTLFRIASLTKPVSAAVTMLLVEEGLVVLDEPVDRLLPELADRRVLRAWDGPLEDTVPAARPILVEDLLTQRMGLGAIMTARPTPIGAAMAEAGVAPGPALPDFPDGDVYLAALAGLPLARHPGEAWLYDTPAQVLGVLIERAAGASLEDVFRTRLLAPLGMEDTGFVVPAASADRLGACWWRNYGTGVVEVFDPAGPASRFARAPEFASASGGLISTLDDYAAFARMMRDGGRHAGRQVLPEAAVRRMTRDHVTPAQKAISPFGPGFWERRGWGYGLSVVTADEADGPLGFGWDGGYGTSGYWDPATGLVGILFTQRLMESPEAPPVFRDFWRSARAAMA